MGRDGPNRLADRFAVCLARQRDSRVPPVARERKGMERAIETLVLALPKGRILEEVIPVTRLSRIESRPRSTIRRRLCASSASRTERSRRST